MFSSAALLSVILASLAVVDASPLSRSIGKTTLHLSGRINSNGQGNVANRDRARIQALRSAHHLNKDSKPVSVVNAISCYTAEIGVGSPDTTYTLIVDTGSSNTWIGANKSYTQTNTSHDTGNFVSVSYGSGAFYGEEYTDTVAFAPDLVIRNQSIGVANSTFGFNGVDGILGVGPVDLTYGTVGNTNTVPTVMDNLLSQGTISEEVLGVYFAPVSLPSSVGTLTISGYDESVITSSVDYVPLTKTSPSSRYWGIDQSISYNGRSLLSTTAGILDTGTTLILIATDAFQKYASLTGGVLDQATGLLAITTEQYANLHTLSFRIGHHTYDLSPNAQIWPRSLNTAISGNSTAIYLIVNDAGAPSGTGLDFINGYAFLERYYSVYDTTNNRVGFASTAHTHAITN